MIAKSDLHRPRPLRPDRMLHPSRRTTAGPHRAIFATNTISELAKITRLAKKNVFSTM